MEDMEKSNKKSRIDRRRDLRINALRAPKHEEKLRKLHKANHSEDWFDSILEYRKRERVRLMEERESDKHKEARKRVERGPSGSIKKVKRMKSNIPKSIDELRDMSVKRMKKPAAPKTELDKESGVVKVGGVPLIKEMGPEEVMKLKESKVRVKKIKSIDEMRKLLK